MIYATLNAGVANNGRRLAKNPPNVTTEGGEARLSVYEALVLMFAFATFVILVLRYIDKRK